MSDDVIYVLSIEDNPAEALLIREKLFEAERVGWDLPHFEINHVDCLRKALDILDAVPGADTGDPVDVVLTDLDLPDSRAGETVATLRDHIPNKPLVVLTGREDEALARISVRAGVQDYLYKNEATGSLLARTMMYAIERQQIHSGLEALVAARTSEMLQSEAMYRQLVETLYEGIWTIDADGYTTFVNPRMADMLGYTVEEMLGEHLFTFMDEAEVAKAVEYMERRQQGRHEQHEFEFVRKDGSSITTLMGTSPQFDAAGHYQGALASVTDITARKNAEANLEAALTALQEAHIRQVEDLNWLTGIVQHLLALSGEDEILAYATRVLQEKLGPCIVLTLTEGDRERTLRLREIRGIDETLIQRAFDVLGFDPWGVTFEIGPDFQNLYRRGRLHRHEGGLPALAASEIPRPIGQALARLLKIDDVYTIGLVGGERVLGNVHILMQQPGVRIQGELVESFATQVALALERAIAHRALGESESRMRTIVEHSTNLFYSHTPEHELTYVSPQARDFLDCEPEEAMIRWTEFVTDHPINSRGLAITERAIETGTAQPPYELELVTPTGRRLWVEVREAPVVEDGETVAVVGSLTDITERRQAEEARRRSEGQLHAILNNTQQSFILIDPSYTIQTFNQVAAYYAEAVFGQALKAGNSIFDFVLPSDEERFTQHFRRALDGETVTVERTIKGRWFSFTYNPIQSDENAITGVCFNTVDIAERKKAEMERKAALKALRESEVNLQALINNTEDIIAAWDRDFRLTIYNDAFGRLVPKLFGIEAKTGIKTIDYLPEDARQRWESIIRRILRGDRHREILESEIEGEKRYYNLAFNPILDQDGNVVGIAEFTHDITRSKHIEENLRHTAERLQIQHEIDTAILRAQSPKEVAHAALVRLDRLLPCRHVGISEIDPAQQRGRELIRLIDGNVHRKTSPWHPISQIDVRLIETVRQGRVHHVTDILAQDRRSSLAQALEAAGIRSYVSVPLMAQDQAIGTLNAGSEKPNFFTAEYVEIMEEVAASLAIAIQQARLLEQTRRDAETKDLLLREVNHRVKNNLDAIIGLLYIERRHAPPAALPAYRPIMEDLTQRITSLAQVHQMLSESEWAPLNLSELVEQIIGTLVQSAAEDVEVTLEVASSPIRISPAQSQHLALILSELTTNTLKYAAVDRDAVRVTVEIVPEGEALTLVYQNDGPGYPADVLNGERTNVGLDIVGQLVEKNLRGRLSLFNDSGAVTRITFKPEELKRHANR
jgi:PAS domain S-box-containing protein